MNIQAPRRALFFALVLAAALSSLQVPLAAKEGFFQAARVQTPFDQGRILSSLVRISANIYWDTIVLETQAQADTLKQSFVFYKGTGRKTYLPQGAILWHVVLTKQQLLAMMEDPQSPYEEGISDIVASFKGVSTFPTERIVPISGWANATFVSHDGLLLTNYHVVREQIEALHREAGCSGETPANFIHAEVAHVVGTQIEGWEPLTRIDLVANLSAADWQSGLDGALLRVRDSVAHGYLTVRDTPASVGEPIWLYGFPFVTNRPAAALAHLDYTNADQSLRVSLGSVTQIKGPDFIADSDGIGGDSGGAVVDANGMLLGYDWDVFGQSATDRLTSFAGGDIIVSASGALARLQSAPRCP
jgi:S1-C subfamily serine protease